MSVIQTWVDKPNLIPLGKKSFYDYFLGVELEVEVKNPVFREDTAQSVCGLLKDFIIVKADASLKYGFEICTRPADLQEHKTNWKTFFHNTIINKLQTHYEL